MPHFRALKISKNQIRKTTHVTDKQPSILKDTFWTNQTTTEFWAIFGLLKYSKIKFEKQLLSLTSNP